MKTQTVSNATHTPGPWHVNAGNAGGDGRYFIDVDRDERLNPTIGAFRELPDAILASSAPDLLAALKEWRDSMTRSQADEYGFGAEWEQAVAAINKAQSHE